jgi:hypothetical protein
MLFTVEEVIQDYQRKLFRGEPKGDFHGALIDSRAVKGGGIIFPFTGRKSRWSQFHS